MNFKVYLAEREMTVTQFARLLEVQPGHLSRALRGKNPMGKRLAADIQRLTQGMVDIPVKKPKGSLTEKI